MTARPKSTLINVPVVDTHVHFLNRERLAYTWMESVPAQLQKTLEPNQYWKEVNSDGLPSKSHKCIAVEGDCNFSSDNPLAEVDYFESLSTTGESNVPGHLIGGVVAYMPMEEGPTAIKPLLASLSKRKIVKGVRRMLQYEANSPKFIMQPEFVDAIKLLAKYNLTFDLCIVQEQLPQVIQLVKACPDVSFVLDHMGKPAIRSSPSGSVDEDWAKNISELAALSNVVAVKVSGLITEANLDSWTRRDVEPYVRHVVKAFGIERCMFGSDWPILRLAGDYERWISVLTAILLDDSSGNDDKLLKSDDHVQMFFSRNAERVYRL